MKKNSLFKTFFPLLIGFLLGKLINQTDLIMLGMLGADEVAAFGVPVRIMIFDMIVAFSLAPVVSVFVANEKDEVKKRNVISNCISLSLILGIILTALGLFLYPLMIQYLVEDTEIASLSSFAVLLLTFAIPARLTQFVSTMVLHSIGRGKKIVYIDSFILILNFGLNYLFMFEFDFGFKGCYISTFFCAFVGFFLMLFEVKKSSKLEKLFVLPKVNWMKEFLGKSSAEWLRLCVLQIMGVITIYLVGSNKEILTAFSASAEVHHFLAIPLIAFMRSIGIVLSSSEKVKFRDKVMEYRNSYKVVLLVTLVVSIVIYFNIDLLGRNIYSLEGNSIKWWNSYLSFVCLGLCVSCINSIFRGGMQSLQRFSVLTKIEFLSKWVIYLPIVIVGLHYRSPVLTWSSILAVEVFELLVLGYIFMKESRSDRLAIEATYS